MPDASFFKRMGRSLKANMREYVVTYIFLFLSILFVIYSGRPMTDIFYQLLSRLTRNLFIVLALIIPIVAGMGNQLCHHHRAMAAPIGLLLVINWGVYRFWAGLPLAAPSPCPWRAGSAF